MAQDSKRGRSRNPWILGGAAVLVLGAAALSYGLLWHSPGDAKRAAAALGGDSELARFAEGPLRALETPAELEPAPDYVFQDAQGDPARFSDYRGRVVVVNLWAMWCRPCRTEMPTLAILAERYRDTDLAVVPVNVDRTEDEIAEARAFLQVHQPLDFASDPDFELPFVFGGRGAMPQTILIDRQGRVR